MNKTHFVSNSSGFSLLELVIGMGLTSIAVLTISQIMINSVKFAKPINEKLEIESLKNLIRVSVNCEETINNLIGSGQNSLLFKKHGAPLFQSENISGKTVMIHQKWRIWVESYSSSAKQFELISYEKVNNALTKERKLFKISGFVCD